MSQSNAPQANANAFLAQAPISKLLLRFSVPCVLSLLVSALYNIVDQIFIGQGVGYLGNAATTVVYPFTVIALAVALLVGDGCAALLSLSLGRGDGETARGSIGNGIVLTAIAAVVLTAVGFLFEDQILTLFGVTEACYAYARDYMTVILMGIPFYMFTSALNGAIRADGDPKYAMVSTVLGAVINLILDPVAIFLLDMGVTGAAVATILGQIASCVLSVLYFRRPRSFQLTRECFRLKGSTSRTICALGVSSLIIQMAIVIVIAVANNMIVLYGPASEYGADIPLSAIGIVMKVFAIVIAFAVGIAVGGQPIVGYNYGAGRYDRVLETLKGILLANVVVGLIAAALFELCPMAIISLFGNESDLYNQYAVLCFRVYLASILLCCIQKASSIFLQSMGKPLQSTLLSLARYVIFFVPGLVLLAPRYGVVGMLWAAPIADVLAILATAILIRREVRAIQALRQA